MKQGFEKLNASIAAVAFAIAGCTSVPVEAVAQAAPVATRLHLA